MPSPQGFPKPGHLMFIFLCHSSLLCAPQGPSADKGHRKGPQSCLLWSPPPKTSHRTSLQCFLRVWPTQLKNNLFNMISFLIVCSLTARWDESALRDQKENVAVRGQKRLKFFAPEVQKSLVSCSDLNLVFGGPGLGQGMDGGQAWSPSRAELPAHERDKVTPQWHRGRSAGPQAQCG